MLIGVTRLNLRAPIDDGSPGMNKHADTFPSTTRLVNTLAFKDVLSIDDYRELDARNRQDLRIIALCIHSGANSVIRFMDGETLFIKETLDAFRL